MATNSTINIGNGTTINGDIQGASDGQGTINIHGNFTSGGGFGVANNLGTDSSGSSLEQINVSAGNTFTLNHDANATRMDINGTVTATGNITAAVTMGASGILNLNTQTDADNSANVTGAIQSGVIDSAQGTLNINGTWATGGAIGQGGKGLAAININSSANNTSLTGWTTTFAHNVNATTITLGTSTGNANATLETADDGLTGTNIEITGNIEGSGNSSSAGILDINTDTYIMGTIGATNTLANVSIAADTILTINSSVTSGNITFESANAKLQVNGTSTITSALDGTSGQVGYGTIEVTPDSTATIVGDIGAGRSLNYITVADNATLNISSNVNLDENINVLGTLNVTGAISINATDSDSNGYSVVIGNATEGSIGSKMTVTDTVSFISDTNAEAIQFNNATLTVDGVHTSHASDTTAYIDLSKEGSANGTLMVQGDFTINMGSTSATYSEGQQTYIAGNGTINIVSGANVTVTNENSGFGLMNFTVNNSTIGYGANGTAASTGTSLIVTSNYKSVSDLGLTAGTNAANVWSAAGTALSSDLALYNAFDDITTAAALRTAVGSLSPASHSGHAAASAAITGASMGTGSARMAFIRQNGLDKGLNAGAATSDENMWMQIFGADVDQDNVSGISGYDADGQGLAIGIDGLSEDGMTRIGIAGSFANTDVTSKDSVSAATTDIDTTQVMVYANKANDDGSYIEGIASMAFNDNTGSRHIKAGSLDRTATSSYDSDLFSVSVEAGWPKEEDGITVTPTVGLRYSSLSTDSYTETGAGGANLTVNPGDVDTFEGKVGVKITGKSVDADGGIGRPEFRLGVSQDFSSDTADSTATFTAGGSSFNTKGVDEDDTKVDVGLGYTYTAPDGNTDVSVDLDARSSSSYLQYGGGLTVKWKF